MDGLWISCGNAAGAKICFATSRLLSPPAPEPTTFRLLLRLRETERRVKSGTVVNFASPVHAVPASHAWFEVLDQRRFTVGHERLTAQVAGIHVVDGETWIQLEFEEDRQRSLLLQLAPETGVAAAVEAIENSLRASGTPPDRLRLA